MLNIEGDRCDLLNAAPAAPVANLARKRGQFNAESDRRRLLTRM
jgi:hypothetical protein